MNTNQIIVGYALNAKKLRKSSHGTIFHLQTSRETGSSVGKWQGGGLADILENDNKALSVQGNGYPVVKFVQWNSQLLASEHPHYDVIIHKLTEDIGIGDEIRDKEIVMNKKILDLELYLKIHPSTVIVDPILSVRKVTSRARTCSTLASIQSKAGEEKCPFNQPKFIMLYEKSSSTSNLDVLSDMKKENINFPVICKPIVACGTTNSHSMVRFFLNPYENL